MPIRKVSNGWKVEGTSTVHKTRAEAMKQLKAIKANQKSKKKG